MNRRAFTLLELLISLGLIGILIGLVLVALSGARTSATRTGSLNTLRQLMQAYTGYSTDNNGRLLPGYVDAPLVDDLGLVPDLPDGTTANATDSGSYVWRLSPYLDGQWRAFFADYDSEGVLTALTQEYSQGVYGLGTRGPGQLGIGVATSFGLNSIFMGGDTRHGGSAVTARNPFTPGPGASVVAATSMAQVRNGARVIVFGATRSANSTVVPPSHPMTGKTTLGYVELRPPFIDHDPATGAGIAATQQWAITGADITPVGDYGAGGGWPMGRWGEDNIPVAHQDGSAEVLDRYEMSVNMSFWSPFFVGVR
jgi:prepilin-type N-terminal cleavage/methylation domain-containing protein